jgi:uracil-DNA glycosylase
MLFTSAIPYSLFNRIVEFMGEEITVKERKCLFHAIFEKMYWTHLHKCFTDASNEKLKFKSKNANKCAGEWLEKELNSAISEKTKFVVALGNNVKGWVDKWKGNVGKDKNVEIIHLPHPSPANVGTGYSWRTKEENEKEKLEREIKKLIKFVIVPKAG